MENKKNIYWIIAGILNLFTALLHAVGGQINLVNPLCKSNLTNQEKAQWMGGWHMITIILFATSILLIKNVIKKRVSEQIQIIVYIGYLYVAFGLSFIISSIFFQILAPQWTLLLPIGLFILFGSKKNIG